MISLAPVGVFDNDRGSPACFASASQHSYFESQVNDAISDVRSEWKRRLGSCNATSEALDSKCVEARHLVVAIDRFMSNGYFFQLFFELL
uniref:Uncharacterized protein n=1 Tax=Parascaris univalens TaxID=6257 RepID=A0A915A5D4_PARUN